MLSVTGWLWVLNWQEPPALSISHCLWQTALFSDLWHTQFILKHSRVPLQQNSFITAFILHSFTNSIYFLIHSFSHYWFDCQSGLLCVQRTSIHPSLTWSDWKARTITLTAIGDIQTQRVCSKTACLTLTESHRRLIRDALHKRNSTHQIMLLQWSSE